MLRIIAGQYRSRKIDAPEGQNTRPTPDRVREALYSKLQNEVYGAQVLDLFAGSGAIGMEAISRGAHKTVFVDQNRQCCQIIRGNLDKLGIESSRFELLNLDFENALARLKGRFFHIIYLDPPYAQGLIPRVFETLVKNCIRFGIAVAESEFDLPDVLSGAVLYDKKRYGRAQLHFYQEGSEMV